MAQLLGNHLAGFYLVPKSVISLFAGKNFPLWQITQKTWGYDIESFHLNVAQVFAPVANGHLKSHFADGDNVGQGGGVGQGHRTPQPSAETMQTCPFWASHQQPS